MGQVSETSPTLLSCHTETIGHEIPGPLDSTYLLDWVVRVGRRPRGDENK